MSKRFVLALIAFFLAPFLLAGCNGGEDFSDADIGGPVIQPSPGSGSPLGPDVDTVEIEFVDDRVLGLGYECRGTEGGTGYTGYVINENTNQFDDEFEGEPVPEVVECKKEATAVDFFLGNAATNDRFELGTAYLPQQGKRQRYQIAPTDIVNSPARLEPNHLGTEDQKRTFYIAALLQGLDNDDAPDNGIIDIPLTAHDQIINCCSSEDDVPTPKESADGLSDYSDYDSFKTSWSEWIGKVDGASSGNIAFPQNPGEVSNTLDDSLERLRSGTYTLEGTLYARRVVEGDDEDDIDNFLAPLLVQIPVLVYPDGVVQGVGYVANITGSLGDFDQSNSTLAAISDGAELSNKLQIAGDGLNSGWELTELFGGNVDLELTGRFLGSNLYYDLDGPLTQSSDYRADFPQSGVYDPVNSDRGFYRGEAFSEVLRDDGELLNGYKTGFVGVDYDEEKLPGGSDQDSAPQFYELTPYKACSGSSTYNNGTCSNFGPDVPEPGNNYNNTVTDDDGENSVDVTQEQPKPLPDEEVPDGERSFNVEIRDGYVYTDLNRDCTATSKVSGQYKDDTGSQEYRVGFVTRTDDGGDDLDPSMNLIIHMTGPGLSEELPHYGLRTSGRINLSTTDQPLYRTGDNNFAEGIRARWVDQAGPSGFAYEVFRRELLDSEDELQSFEERESITRGRGALEGSALEQASGGGCTQP